MLAACSGGLSKNKNVSEYRDNVFLGQSSNYTAEAVTGFRETPFEIDGVSTEKCDFCLVTIKPKAFDPTVEYGYKFTYDNTDYEGKLNKHPFENTYSFEVPVWVKDGEFKVEIDGESIQFSSVKTELFITPEKAYEIAAKRLSGNEIYKGNNEIYVRLISNPVNATGGYFWYVAFVDQNRETAAVLIEPETMEIIAVRE